MKGQKNFVSIIFIIFLCIGVMLSLLSLRSAMKVKERTRKNIKEIENKLEQFRLVPTRGEIIYLTTEKGILEKDYESVKWIFNVPEAKMPNNIPTTLQFKTLLLNTHNECREVCFSNAVELVTSLGFDEYSKGAIPSLEELPNLVKELQIEKEMIELLVKAKVRRIEGIKFLKPIDTTVSNLTIREFPIAFSIVGEEQGLVNTLYNLRISKFLFQVRDIKVASAGTQDKEVMANIVLTVKVFL